MYIDNEKTGKKMTVYVKKEKNTTLEDGVDNLMNAMIEDYTGESRWTSLAMDRKTDMQKRYVEGLVATKGKKYWKIIQDDSATSFIVAVDDEELNGPLKMQNIVGNFSRTPGKVKHAELIYVPSTLPILPVARIYSELE